VDAYTKAQGLFRTDATPTRIRRHARTGPGESDAFARRPKRPQDRVELARVKENFHAAFPGNGKSAQAESMGKPPLSAAARW